MIAGLGRRLVDLRIHAILRNIKFDECDTDTMAINCQVVSVNMFPAHCLTMGLVPSEGNSPPANVGLPSGFALRSTQKGTYPLKKDIW